MLFDDIEEKARAWRGRGLERSRRVIDSMPGRSIEWEGRRFLSFLSNDYLGLAKDPRLIEALAEGARTFGAGAGASPLISGHLRCHQAAEAALADFVGSEQALLFITGYVANLAVLTTFAEEGAEVFSDELNHASLIDGCRLSRANISRYPHLDLLQLETLLQNSSARRKIIVSDAVFSMDGDQADLTALARLAEKYDALLVVDDAHGFGVMGPEGRGSWAATGLRSRHVLQVITFGKAAGLSGAAVLGDALLVNALIQHARTYVFSTSPLPALAAAIPRALALMAEESWRREHLKALIGKLWGGLSPHGLLPRPPVSPIVPIPVGEAQAAMAWADALAAEGVLVAGIRPPTVPLGEARLRISVSAAHTEEDIDQLVNALRQTQS